MSTEHVVVPTAECHHDGCPPAGESGMAYRGGWAGRCDGCLGDGRRALLGQAVPVEQTVYGPGWPVRVGDPVWAEVES